MTCSSLSQLTLNIKSASACRLLGLDPAAQKHVFDTFQAVLEATVEEARREGNYDEGIVDVAGSSVALTAPPQTVRTVRTLPLTLPLTPCCCCDDCVTCTSSIPAPRSALGAGHHVVLELPPNPAGQPNSRRRCKYFII